MCSKAVITKKRIFLLLKPTFGQVYFRKKLLNLSPFSSQTIKLKNRIFVIGGLQQPAEKGFSNEAYYYNMDDGPNGKWIACPKFKMKRGDFGVFTEQGDTENEIKEITEQFGYPGMSISGAPGGGGMDRSASRSTETTSSNTEILIVGGLGHSFDQKIQEGRPLDTCESLIITDNGPKRSWSSIQNLDIGRASASFVKCGKYYYLIGGLSYTAGSDPKDQDKNGPSSRVDKIRLG